MTAARLITANHWIFVAVINLAKTSSEVWRSFPKVVWINSAGQSIYREDTCYTLFLGVLADWPVRLYRALS